MVVVEKRPGQAVVCAQEDIARTVERLNNRLVKVAVFLPVSECRNRDVGRERFNPRDTLVNFCPAHRTQQVAKCRNTRLGGVPRICIEICRYSRSVLTDDYRNAVPAYLRKIRGQ